MILRHEQVSLVAQMVKNLPAIQETRVPSLGREDPLKKGMATTPGLLPEEFYRQRSLASYHPWGQKELDTIDRVPRRISTELIFL